MKSSRVILNGHYILCIAPPCFAEVKDGVLADRRHRQLLEQIAF